ncbi:MAG TPA: hypothetical protein VH253_13115 [Phycisphaerae bacterium]|nr:hypothetical protein [Phycisphaerae bacterium]
MRMRLYFVCLVFLGVGLLFDLLTWQDGFPLGWNAEQWAMVRKNAWDYAFHYNPYLVFPAGALLLLLPASVWYGRAGRGERRTQGFLRPALVFFARASRTI